MVALKLASTDSWLVFQMSWATMSPVNRVRCGCCDCNVESMLCSSFKGGSQCGLPQVEHGVLDRPGASLAWYWRQQMGLRQWVLVPGVYWRSTWVSVMWAIRRVILLVLLLSWVVVVVVIGKYSGGGGKVRLIGGIGGYGHKSNTLAQKVCAVSDGMDS